LQSSHGICPLHFLVIVITFWARPRDAGKTKLFRENISTIPGTRKYPIEKLRRF
jgi:hypothetical protein